ncbi:hypothetical protein CD351_15365 [Erythrobacter sp. KY5]|uniref:DUF4350 domain-containing protein n=1 Tax=Erythrobacter sp. KY5 TaxID=2011159 RepID=UPI000DBF23A9|nr:DUF4350 domain-containing protein [Erythrobacter sp. KY5]AWW75808.1 hypothetical protein CD351_15365 [Erythrobacter sp. KY5]
MSEVATLTSTRGAAPFRKGTVLAVVLVGFAAFLAMLYFIGAGDTGGNRPGPAHASANGLNGYSGLYRLLRAEGIEVERSRSPERLTTSNLLVLTPPQNVDFEEFSDTLQSRRFYGPTLVILPKWIAGPPQGEVVEEDELRMRDDWVTLSRAAPAMWTQDLPEPYAFTYGAQRFGGNGRPRWYADGRQGKMPTRIMLHAEEKAGHRAIVTNTAGHSLAFQAAGDEGINPVIFIVEPDLVNNYGLADGQRAGLALDLVRLASNVEGQPVTFDMTYVGFGQTMNLLTLAFRPPFLAATLCLILALVIVGWRAFLRFGPAAVSGQAIAFGKNQLVSNGAGLIVRARRLGLLADPYVHLIQRRVGKALGIARPDGETIDAAIAQRLPDQEPFSHLAARLHDARRPAEILRAAKALSALSSKLTGKSAQ